jgi:hypothetical protein
MTEPTESLGEVCAVNINARGIRLRRRSGRVMTVATFGALAATVLLHAPWFARLLVALPAGVAAVSFLQAQRST